MPLILTLALDAKSQAYFNALRKEHFPPERNYLDAHLTLFHALPSEWLVALQDELTESASNTPAFSMQVSGLMSLGKGVAFSIESLYLKELHEKLRLRWLEHLSPQDRQKLRPHVTIQNKVLPEQARHLKVRLEKEFQIFEIVAEGFLLWEYLDGPWRLLKQFPFATD